MADQTLDAKGLNCPLPILRAKKALTALPAGATLEVLATDPGAVKDFEAFCRTTGHELLESIHRGQRLPLRAEAQGMKGPAGVAALLRSNGLACRSANHRKTL